MFEIVDAKTHLSQLIDQACQGEEIVIARKGRPLVRLVPVTAVEAQPATGKRETATSR